MFKKIFQLIISLSFISLAVGCASSAVATKEAVSLPRTLKLMPVQGEATQFVERFLVPFKDAGFRIGETDDPDAAVIRVQFDPNLFHTAFDVSVTKNGTMILKSEASNSGWGTGIARPQALEKLAAEVENGLRTELSAMRLTITQDKSLQRLACQEVMSDQRLSSLAGKVSLDFDKSPSFSILTNKMHPSADEVKAIEVWANLEEKCMPKKVEAVLTNGDQSRADQIIVSFNERQAAMADLAMNKLTYGDFARRMVAISNFEKQARNQREESASSRLDKEKDRAIDKTTQIQQSAQGAASVYKPTFTRCNRIGTQVFCNSY